MKINHTLTSKSKLHAGFSSILVVISVGMGLLIILVSMYENTVESQAVEKKILQKNDYQQREDAFLRALTTIIPNKAMICMQDDSMTIRDELSWEAIMEEALSISNSHSAVDPDVAQSLGLDTLRNANVTNTQVDASKVVTPLAKAAYQGPESDEVTGHWEDITVREWVDGYTIPGEWVDGYTKPREWVDGYYISFWWYGREFRYWVEGYWKEGETVEGYWTEPTYVEGYWVEKTERQWVEDNVIANPDPGVTGNLVTSGTNQAASSSYPPPLECTSEDYVIDSHYPMVSYTKQYGKTATGWVADNVDEYPLYNRVLAPNVHFNYQNNNRLIAKHNWWAFELGHSRNDKDKTKLTLRTKKYLISLYEVPSQLAINASSYTALGKHADGTAWANIQTEGGIFAEKIKTQGSFSADYLSSRKGVSLSNRSNIGGTTGSGAGNNPFASHAREIAESKGQVFPISSASDGGRVAFIPINRGLDFYDRYAGTGSSWEGTNSVSPTSWDYYSIGAKQCTMRMDVIDVASSTNQTPTAIRFSYSANGTMTSEEFIQGDSWPDPATADGEAFPFHIKTTSSGRPAIAFYSDRLKDYLASKGADQYTTNNCISINVDYPGNASIRKPSFPSEADDIAVILTEAEDFTAYTKGFSIVTNLRLIIADDTNITSTTPPSGVTVPSGEEYYPPLSMFAPEKRYGDSGTAVPVTIEGQIGSMAKGNSSPTRIADLKSGPDDEVIPENIRADLHPIVNPAALPPITMMNWMVVVREIHPKFSPAEDGVGTSMTQ
ncbi:MAG: hypothetical protein H7A51_19115 [Akkermansiaceae bacterium]|nr:hypothetical protein [Akkermansiaceae bacterium]